MSLFKVIHCKIMSNEPGMLVSWSRTANTCPNFVYILNDDNKCSELIVKCSKHLVHRPALFASKFQKVCGNKFGVCILEAL